MKTWIYVVIGAVVILLLVVVSTLACGQDVPDGEPHLGPPEVVFACKQTPTLFEGRVLGCVECPDTVNERTFNTCTGVKKWN